MAGNSRVTREDTMRTIQAKKKGQRNIKFKPGALHAQLGIPQEQKIPAGKMAEARSGQLGPLAEKRANFAKNILKGR